MFILTHVHTLTRMYIYIPVRMCMYVCVCVCMRARLCMCVRMRINEHAHRQNFLCNTTWVSLIIAKNPVNIQRQVSSISRLSHLNPLPLPSNFSSTHFLHSFTLKRRLALSFTYISVYIRIYAHTCTYTCTVDIGKDFLNSIKKQSEFISTLTCVCIYIYVCIYVYIHVQWILEKTPALSLTSSSIVTTLGWNNIGR